MNSPPTATASAVFRIFPPPRRSSAIRNRDRESGTVAGQATDLSRGCQARRRVRATLAPRRLEYRFVKPRPLLALVEQQRRIDDAQRRGAEGWLQLAPGGHEAALGEDALPRLADHEVVVEERGVRMRRPAREPEAVGPCNRRRDHEPVERRALALELLGGEVVHRERERHLARGDEICEQRMAAAHRDAAHRDEIAEKAQSLGLPEPRTHR